MLKKINRLTRQKDIEALMKQGKAVYFFILMLKYKKNGLAKSRFAIIVSNKVSKKAVKRNLIKRRFREIIRLNLAKITVGFDAAVIASPKIIDQQGKVASYQKIEEELLAALKKSGLL